MRSKTSIKRVRFVETSAAAIGAAVASSSFASAQTEVAAMTSSAGKPSIVFCHGLWADGSCFTKVMGPLQAQGYYCIAAQYPLNTPENDVTFAKWAMDVVKGPIVLVGHSYGGTVITAAGTDSRLEALVYINALAPDTAAGETSLSIQQKFPATDVLEHIKVVDGRIWSTKEGLRYFCGDLSATEQQLVWATQGAPAANIFTQDAPGVAWKTKPSWYIVGKKDHTVNPDLERFLAKRMKAKTTELDSSHVPMLSQPDRVVDVILSAAKSV
ncbi:MAG TPA: alpha/beta hydrolase [Candidatus Baltobacteraceae bacterium]|jgi:pimeloyl-ACP methyl ester carboxylesterase|nr:alpha/beta hydrolase [Candidatus Baltobacteraceae bacterium]